MDVASLSDTLDLSILEEDSLVRQIQDLASPPAQSPPLKDPSLGVSDSSIGNQTQMHQQLLEDARAGKKVDNTKSRSTQPVLPGELLMKVFKFLAGYQSDLCSAALVSVEWNHWATGQLYRYPEFANTIHWAMFIQTLCKSKEDEVKRPTTTSRRYRPPIFTPTSLSPHLGDHPPIYLAPGQMATFEAKLQQRRQDRLDRTLGEYVRGIDLSRKAIGTSRFCPCGRPYGPPVSMNECSVCPRPGKAPSKAIGVFHISPRTTTGQSEQGTTSSVGGSTGGEDEEDDEEDGDGFDDEEINNLDPLTGQQSRVATASGYRLADDTLYTRTGDYMSTLQPGPRTGLENVQVTVMDGIEALGKSCPKLGRVWLVGCDWVTHREVLALTSSCRQLQMMDARNCPRLEGRLSRLYVVMKRQEADNAGLALDHEKSREEDADAESDDIPNERVATPLEFETAPTTVLLGANVAGRGVRDGAMDDLFCWVYITAFVGTNGTPTTTPTTTGTTATTRASTLSPQAVNDILGMLSSVPLPREAPADPVAFQEWLKAIERLDLVSYKPLKRLRPRFDIACGPPGRGQVIDSTSGGGGG
ncbi:hypothetical protein BGZ95_006755, partial [Linnemannia exigua]